MKIRNHITPVLKSLHWLPVVQRYAFKTALLTFKVIHGLAPSYLCELIRYHSTFHDLRSNNDVLLDVTKHKSCIGSHAFVCSAPKLLNVCLRICALNFLMQPLNANSRHIYFG